MVDPIRVQILMTSTARKLSATEFAEEWDIPDWGAHYHCKVLRERAFIRVVERVQRRGATEIYYRATRRCFIPDPDWAALSPMFKAPISNAILEELWLAIADAAEPSLPTSRETRMIRELLNPEGVKEDYGLWRAGNKPCKSFSTYSRM